MVFSGLSMTAMQFIPGMNKFNDVLKNQMLSMSSKIKPTEKSGSQILDLGTSEDNQKIESDGDSKTVSKSSTEYKIDGDNYVLINGKYYKARPDNIYEINGEKVFFLNNRAQASKEEESVPDSESDSSLGKLPTSPEELMKSLQASQKAMAERNKALEEIK